TLALLEQKIGLEEGGDLESQIQDVQRQCVFTTHTPVPAGHDRFSVALVNEVLGERRAAVLSGLNLLNGELNMTELALRLSRYTNGVSMRHAEVSRAMFPT